MAQDQKFEAYSSIAQKQTEDLQELGKKFSEIATKKVEVAKPAIQAPAPTAQKRKVRLRKIVGCGCGDSFLEITREVDENDPLKDGDVVDSIIKGDRLAR